MKPFFPTPLPAEVIDALIAERVAWILETCAPLRIVAFGSAARGSMTAGSDIDLIVILLAGGDVRATYGAILGRKPPHDVALDLLVYTEDEFEARATVGGVCFVAGRDGRVVFPVDFYRPQEVS